MPDINTNSSQSMQNAVKETASAGLVVQNYCTGIQQQPLLYLPKDLKEKMPDVNGYIKIAQDNADMYLHTVEGQIVKVITDVSGFSVLFPRMANDINNDLKAWSTGSLDNKQQALDAIAALRKTVQNKCSAVQVVAAGIGDVARLFNGDVAHFQEVSQACATHLTGDKGELEELKKQISSIDKKITGAAVGVGVSGLAIAGGVFMILIGSIASFVTAGTSTPLAVIGGTIVCAGAAGLTASSVVLADLIKSKGDLLKRQTTLNSYVSALEGCKSSVDLLYSSTQEAARKLDTMKNTWEFLGGDLDQVEGMLKEAQSYSDMPKIVQEYFASGVEQWASVHADIEIIKKQMAGVEIKQLPSGQKKQLQSAGAGSDGVLGEISGDAIRLLVS